MSKYTEFYEKPKRAVALITNDYVTRNREYIIVGEYPCSNGERLYEVLGNPHLYSMDKFRIVGDYEAEYVEE